MIPSTVAAEVPDALGNFLSTAFGPSNPALSDANAIVIDPMNALASDQARRIAGIVDRTPSLHGKVTAGLYVRERPEHRPGSALERTTSTSEVDECGRGALRVDPYAASRRSGWHMQCTPPPAQVYIVMSGS